VIFIESRCNDAAYHFSVEELFTCSIRDNSPVLMLWQTDKTVMLGSNQIVKAEVDVDIALESGIKIVRRSSGGGAIYTDPGTILYTVIRPMTKEAFIHKEETAVSVINALNKMGVPAIREGRNDITAEGRKISGLAQYTSGSHICTHGSLLYDTDLETLSKVLIANEKKLHPKGITSIRSRVTNIKPYMENGSSVGDFMDILKNHLLSGFEYSIYLPGKNEQVEINKIYQNKYANPEWNLRM